MLSRRSLFAAALFGATLLGPATLSAAVGPTEGASKEAAKATTEADLKTALQQVQQAFLWIEHFYVDTVNVSEMSTHAIRGILKELDPHSTYLTPSEVQRANEPLEGNFEGIGIHYQMDRDTLLVINTIIGGPSEKAGLRAGDRILAVNDTTIAGVKMSNDEVQRRLRGPKGSHVRVAVRRAGEAELIPFDLTRDRIPLYSVDAAYLAAPEVGYIKVSRFGKNTHEELLAAADSLRRQGMKHLIVDLQGNGGGYLGAAVDMAGEFLPKNSLVVYTEGRAIQRDEYRTSRNGSLTSGRLVVLIDEQSASASEIFSGAMQDLDRGVLVGRRSFGKGLVQRPVPLPGGAMMRLTVSHYYTPSGRCIQKPYTKGDKESYDRDLLHRYQSGQLLSADSIHFADSLRCYTLSGRTVYGGGGIMPDLFVPVDTGRVTRTHRNLLARGTFNRFVLAYFDRHHDRLLADYPSADDFATRFAVTDDLLSALREKAEADSVHLDSTEWERSLPLISLQLKAALANDLYGTSAYYRIISAADDVYQRAVALISDERQYRRLLRPEMR
jgi:carboxyl-terminal processing protease